MDNKKKYIDKDLSYEKIERKDKLRTYEAVNSCSFVSPKDSSVIISKLLDVIDESSPLPKGHNRDLRHDILCLWRDLTSDKSEREPDYIGEPAKLSSYLRYFLPWNVVRLVPILANLDLALEDGDMLLDIGSGPLTMITALWVACPQLRSKKLIITCVDRVKRIMESGLHILEGLALRCGESFSWQIELQKEIFSFTPLSDKSKKAVTEKKYKLITAGNVFNECFWKQSGSLSERAMLLRDALCDKLLPLGRFFIMEPGDPRSGAMLAALREAVILSGGVPLAPCTHKNACPISGVFRSSVYRDNTEESEIEESKIVLKKTISPKGRSKAPWCHFVLDKSAACKRLLIFSESVGLAKDRLIASWLYMKIDNTDGYENKDENCSLRMVSDKFFIPRTCDARYACSATGYSIVTGKLSDYESGTKLVLDSKLPCKRDEKDVKSGAIVIKSKNSQSSGNFEHKKEEYSDKKSSGFNKSSKKTSFGRNKEEHLDKKSSGFYRDTKKSFGRNKTEYNKVEHNKVEHNNVEHTEKKHGDTNKSAKKSSFEQKNTRKYKK